MNMKDTDHTPVITLVGNGPIKISGNFVLKDADDSIIENRGDAYICRCGKSARKPFCDGTHKKSCD